MLRNPIMLIPDAISVFTEAHVSLERISKYLDHPEVDNDDQQQQTCTQLGFQSSSVFAWPQDVNNNTKKEHTNNNESKPLVDNDHTSYGATATLSPFQLRIPHGFAFPKNKLSLVIGPTGSGKSSLLYAVLGEMDTLSGGSYRPNMLSYVAQHPFLQQTSIRDNILFGMPYHKARYHQVLHQCALVKDLAILPDGDMTEIGEKGISLSGGQKQRQVWSILKDDVFVNEGKIGYHWHVQSTPWHKRSFWMIVLVQWIRIQHNILFVLVYWVICSRIVLW